LHHVEFDIDNIEKKIEIFKKRGISILQSQKYAEAHSAYLKTEKEGGMIIELIQRKARRVKYCIYM
jgi:hypothetical protein